MTTSLPRLATYTEAIETSRACRDAVRFIQCLAHSYLDGGTPAEMFAKRYPESGYLDAVRRAEVRHKAAVPAATPGGAVWASPLMPATMGQSLVTFSDQFSVTGRLRLVTAPFNVRMPAETDPLTGGTWFGNGGAPLVVLSGTFEAASYEPLGIGGIVVITEELARATDARAEAFLQRLLGRALAEYLDAQFCDPSVAAVEHLNPASVTNSATPIASAGSSLEAAKADLRGLIAAYKAAGARLERAALLMSSENASYLRLTGDPAFAELTTAGGRVAGVETFASDAVGTRVILAD